MNWGASKSTGARCACRALAQGGRAIRRRLPVLAVGAGEQEEGQKAAPAKTSAATSPRLLPANTREPLPPTTARSGCSGSRPDVLAQAELHDTTNGGRGSGCGGGGDQAPRARGEAGQRGGGDEREQSTRASQDPAAERFPPRPPRWGRAAPVPRAASPGNSGCRKEPVCTSGEERREEGQTCCWAGQPPAIFRRLWAPSFPPPPSTAPPPPHPQPSTRTHLRERATASGLAAWCRWRPRCIVLLVQLLLLPRGGEPPPLKSRMARGGGRRSGNAAECPRPAGQARAKGTAAVAAAGERGLGRGPAEGLLQKTIPPCRERGGVDGRGPVGKRTGGAGGG